MVGGVPIAHGVLVPPTRGKLTVPMVVSFLFDWFRGLRDTFWDAVVVEEVVWQGKSRKITLPLALVTGALVGWFANADVPVYLLTPTMKERGKLPFKVSGWSEHECDAARLALRIENALRAMDSSSPPRASVERSLRTIAARRVPPQL